MRHGIFKLSKHLVFYSIECYIVIFIGESKTTQALHENLNRYVTTTPDNNTCLFPFRRSLYCTESDLSSMIYLSSLPSWPMKMTNTKINCMLTKQHNNEPLQESQAKASMHSVNIQICFKIDTTGSGISNSVCVKSYLRPLLS